jgi:hypothetical protein
MMKMALLLLASLAAAPVFAEEAKPLLGPRIAVEPASHDFGDALQQKTLTKEFSIRNFGTADLVIENVQTSCGCTVADLETKVVKPGGSTPLRVSLQTRGNSGRIAKSVLVKSNDPTKNVFELKIQANVIAAAATSR